MDLKIFSGETSALANDIARELGVGLSRIEVKRFSNGDERVKLPDGVRGANVFLIQSIGGDPYRMLRLMHMADAAWHASARKVIAVTPEFGWARQESMHQNHSSLGASLAVRLMHAAGVNHLVAMDLHKETIELAVPQGMPFDKLYASPVFGPELVKIKAKEPGLIMLVPDQGAMPRATYYIEKYGLMPMIVVHQQRDPVTGKKRIVQIVGQLEGDEPIISLDDMIDTGGTIVGVDIELRRRGWHGKHFLFATHGVLSGDGISTLNESEIAEIHITDTVVHREQARLAGLPKFKIHTVASIFADCIRKIHADEGSVSEQFA